MSSANDWGFTGNHLDDLATILTDLGAKQTSDLPQRKEFEKGKLYFIVEMRLPGETAPHWMNVRVKAGGYPATYLGLEGPAEDRDDFKAEFALRYNILLDNK